MKRTELAEDAFGESMMPTHRKRRSTALTTAVFCTIAVMSGIGATTDKPGPTPAANQSSSRSDELLMFLQPGTSIAVIEARYGLIYKQTLKSDANAHIFVAGNAVQGLATRQLAAQDTAIRQVYENRRTHKVRHAFVPNDPYFHKETPLGWGGRGQWHLANEYTEVDSNISGAWAQNITGAGVTIGIVDDGLETTHPDLSPNYVASNSWDFGQDDAIPDPVYTADRHGVSVAGVAAARGGNGIGVVGAAPYAGVAGLRIDFDFQTVAMFVDATLYQSSGGSNAIAVKNHSYGVSISYTPSVAESDAVDTSTAAGTIHLFSAGNDRGNGGDDSNKKEPQNNPNALAVAALGFDGVFAQYSCFGANVVVTAPSSDVFSSDAITTTDRTGIQGYNTPTADGFPDDDYTSLFGGTSSATPLVAGIMALAKQVQPQFDNRFAKHILARTCRMIDPMDATASSDGGWRTNSAGFRFNQNYGFGLIDAEKLVNAARAYSGVTPLTTESVPTTAVGAAIADYPTNGVTRTFNLSSHTPLEEILITVDVSHTFNNDIEIHLTSPDGHKSRVAKQNYGSSETNGFSWTFCSHAFWGCDPQGTWTLDVSDRAAEDTGTWNSFSVSTRMGELVEAPPLFAAANASSPGNMTLNWISAPGREYTLGYSSNLLSGFSTVVSNIIATPYMNTYTDTLHSADQQFWQLTVEP